MHATGIARVAGAPTLICNVMQDHCFRAFATLDSPLGLDVKWDCNLCRICSWQDPYASPADYASKYPPWLDAYAYFGESTAIHAIYPTFSVELCVVSCGRERPRAWKAHHGQCCTWVRS